MSRILRRTRLRLTAFLLTLCGRGSGQATASGPGGRNQTTSTIISTTHLFRHHDSDSTAAHRPTLGGVHGVDHHRVEDVLVPEAPDHPEQVRPFEPLVSLKVFPRGSAQRVLRRPGQLEIVLRRTQRVEQFAPGRLFIPDGRGALSSLRGAVATHHIVGIFHRPVPSAARCVQRSKTIAASNRALWKGVPIVYSCGGRQAIHLFDSDPLEREKTRYDTAPSSPLHPTCSQRCGRRLRPRSAPGIGRGRASGPDGAGLLQQQQLTIERVDETPSFHPRVSRRR